MSLPDAAAAHRPCSVPSCRVQSSAINKSKKTAAPSCPLIITRPSGIHPIRGGYLYLHLCVCTSLLWKPQAPGWSSDCWQRRRRSRRAPLLSASKQANHGGLLPPPPPLPRRPPRAHPAVRAAVHAPGDRGGHEQLHRGARGRRRAPRRGVPGALPRRHRRHRPARRLRLPRRRHREEGRLLPGAAAAGAPQPPPRRQAPRLRRGPPRQFLVFDHMENRSLKECLHDPLRTPLDWRTRLQVAIDIEAALEYLYYFCDPPVFHVSVNSSNVLMDANFVAKLSDVGVISHDDMKLATTESFQDHVEQRRAGLVFQYGVLVLELVTGQSPGGDGELVRWVQEPGFAGTMHRMVDADLGGVYDARELRDLVIVARLCTRHGGDDGAAAVVSIPQIVRYLQGKVERLGGGEARRG